jgi:8-oxo-dGTP pyrophosphatase MutT (NUDIX family)
MSPDDLRRCLTMEPVSTPGDYDIYANGVQFRIDDRQLTGAAVLIPIIARPEGATVVFTERAADLRSHGGQISFPGGKMDPEDIDDIATALREAEEEISLPRHAVDVIGRLGRYETGTGFAIHPVVALVPSNLVFTPQSREVASVFEVPLAYLIDPENIETHYRTWNDINRAFYAITYQERYIWGATAGIVAQLARQLGSTIDALA